MAPCGTLRHLAAAEWRVGDVNQPVRLGWVSVVVAAPRVRTVTGGLTSPARLFGPQLPDGTPPGPPPLPKCQIRNPRGRAQLCVISSKNAGIFYLGAWHLTGSRMACGRCQSAGPARLGVGRVGGADGAYRYWGINIPRSPFRAPAAGRQSRGPPPLPNDG
jgi:hypothetical protein